MPPSPKGGYGEAISGQSAKQVQVLSKVEEQAFLDTIIAEPDDDVHGLVYANWLEEHGRLESAHLARLYAEMLSVALDGDGSVEWESVEALIRQCHRRSRFATWLALVRLHRASRAKYPVPWEKISTWPAGWSSERCRDSINATLAAVEQAALQRSAVTEEVVARHHTELRLRYGYFRSAANLARMSFNEPIVK